MVDWSAVAAIATVILAVVTAALAAATVWLGAQTRDVSQATGRLATRTGEELDLLRQQVELQRRALQDSQRERDESRRPILVWSHSGARSEQFSGRRQFIADLVLRNHGQIAFVQNIKVVSSTPALDESVPDRPIRQQIGPSEGVQFPLRVWAYAGDETAHHSILLTGYAKAITPGARLEEFPVRVEIAAGSGGLTLEPLEPGEAEA